MKSALVASVWLALGGLAARQSPLATAELVNVFPADAKVEQIALTSDEQRTYYTTTSGDTWFFDRVTHASAQLVSGVAWDLAVAPSRDGLVFARGGETRRQQQVWLLPLDANTGLAVGPARMVSAQPGDVPSFSPDGQSIAFARDDSTGVGQSVVVVPTRGGAERVVVGGMPSSIGNIRWTPDGNTLYFGVNPPVPFTCAESCLSLPAGTTTAPGTIRRVAAAGGAVTVVATTGSPSPGLSPDGTILVFADIAGNRQFVIADPAGRRLGTFTLPGAETPWGWYGRSTLLTLNTATARRFRAISIADALSSLR